MTHLRTLVPLLVLLPALGCSGGPTPATDTVSGPVAAPAATTQPPVTPEPSSTATSGSVVAPPAAHIAETDDFGLVRVVRRSPTVVVEVDRVDMLGGQAAERAAAADGTEVSNDYYLVNDNAQRRAYEVSDDAQVWGSIRMEQDVDGARVPISDWLAFVDRSDSAGTLFHLDLEGGVVVGVEEQYRP